MPREKYLPSPAAYAELLRDIGFSQVRVRDITAEGWRSFARFELAEAHASWLAGRSEFSQLLNRCVFVYAGAAIYSHNVLCVGVR
jgi:hypothetical protein